MKNASFVVHQASKGVQGACTANPAAFAKFWACRSVYTGVLGLSTGRADREHGRAEWVHGQTREIERGAERAARLARACRVSARGMLELSTVVPKSNTACAGFLAGFCEIFS